MADSDSPHEPGPPVAPHQPDQQHRPDQIDEPDQPDQPGQPGQQPDSPARERGPQRLVIGVTVGALVLVLAVIATVVVLANRARSQASAPDTGPLAVPAAPAPGADGRYCRVLMEALPDDLVHLPRRTLADRQPGVAAWGDPAVILRCGLADPAELTCSSRLTQFTDATGGSVAWLQLSDSSAVTYIAVDRPVRIAVTLPPDTGVGPIQQLSELIAADLPVRPVCSGGTVTKPDNG